MASPDYTLIVVGIMLLALSLLKNNNGECPFALSARWTSIGFFSLALGKWCSISASALYEISLIGAGSVFLIGSVIGLAALGGINRLLPPTKFKTPPDMYWGALKLIGSAACALSLIWGALAFQISLWTLTAPFAFIVLIMLVKWLSRNGKKAN